MNLIFDIGNTRTKATVFVGGEIVGRYTGEGDPAGLARDVLGMYPSADAAIVSSTRREDDEVYDALRDRIGRVVVFGADTPVPIDNMYRTPGSLGRDRLAAAVGANFLWLGRNLLVVDFGTAITFDVVTATGQYLGGNISPGAGMRLRALHEKTGNLPLLHLPDSAFGATSDTTEDAVRNGVAAGITFEIEGYATRLGAEYEDLCIIFTGGDADYFAKQVKNPIFAQYDLVAIGLNRILEYNAD